MRLREKIIFVIGSLTYSLIILELVAWFVEPSIKLAHGHIGLGVGGRDVLEYPVGYLKDRDLFWKLHPSVAGHNSAGFRDKEFAVQKEKGTFRIICIGDSITFGFPVPREDTYPKKLEQLLNIRIPEKNFEVINAGVPGYTSYQGAVLIKKEIINYDPDLIIAYFGINDRTGVDRPDKEQKKLPLWIVNSANFLGKFHLYQVLNKIVLYILYPPGRTEELHEHRVSADDYKDNLVQMREIASRQGIKILFIARPVLYDVEKKFLLTDDLYTPPERVNAFDIYNVFKPYGKKAARFFVDDVRPHNFHLSYEGQLLLAEKLTDFLEHSVIFKESNDSRNKR